MLRLIHNQTVQGGILVDDIDDGLPNKEVHRLGSTANPKAYERDGYAGKPKQSCYIPYTRGSYGFPLVQGYINLNQTNRVILSTGKGKIFKLSEVPSNANESKAGASNFPLITTVTFTASQIVAPVVTAAVHATSSPTPATIAGTTFLSVQPDVTVVTYARGSAGSTPSPATFTAAQIVTAGGTISGTAVSIPYAAFSTAPVVGNTVFVSANELTSNTFTLT
jgi:hypothetical protein